MENERRDIYLLKRAWGTWINGYVPTTWKCVSNKNYIYSALRCITNSPRANNYEDLDSKSELT